MSKKLLQYYQSRMDVGGKVLPKFQYTGQYLPDWAKPIPRATGDISSRIPQPVILKTKQEADREALINKAYNNGTIKIATKQNPVKKAIAIVAHPMTAASYAVKGQRIPDNFEKGNTNIYDLATPLVNPASLAYGAVEIPANIKRGEYLQAGMNALVALPMVKAISPSIGKTFSSVKSYGKDLAYSLRNTGSIPTYRNVARWEADQVPEFLKRGAQELTDQQKGLTGSWYTYKPEEQLGFYMQTRPGAGNVNVLRMSDRQINNLEQAIPDYAKGMSGKVTNTATSDSHQIGELVVPQNIRSNAKQFRFDVNPSEYVVPQDVAPNSAFGRSSIGNFTNDVINSNYKNILGIIPRKYFPFKEGGSLPKFQVESLVPIDYSKYSRRASADKTRVATSYIQPFITAEEARKKQLAEYAKRAAAKQTYVGPGPTANQQIIRDAAARERNIQQIKENSPLAQTMGSMTPSGYNPGAGAIGAKYTSGMIASAPFVSKAISLAPYIAPALETSIFGVPGLTTSNLLNAGFATYGLNRLPNTVQGFKNAKTTGDYLNATGNAALNLLDIAPMGFQVAKGLPSVANDLRNVGEYLTTQTPLRNAYKINPNLENPLGFRNVGDKPDWWKGYTKEVTPETIDLQAGFPEYLKKYTKIDDDLYKARFNKKGETRFSYDEFLKRLGKERSKLLEKTPLGKELGFGSYGTVYEFKNYPQTAVKIGQPFGPRRWNQQLINELAPLREKGNIAIPSRLEQFNTPLPYPSKGTMSAEVSIMDNLNTNNFNKLNLSGRDAYALLLKQARQLKDKGVYLDFSNFDNFKFNPKKGVWDIYDINPGLEPYAPSKYMLDLKYNLDRKVGAFTDLTKNPNFQARNERVKNAFFNKDAGDIKIPGNKNEYYKYLEQQEFKNQLGNVLRKEGTGDVGGMYQAPSNKIEFKDPWSKDVVYRYEAEDFNNFKMPEDYRQALSMMSESKRQWFQNLINQRNKSVNELKKLAEYGDISPLFNKPVNETLSFPSNIYTNYNRSDAFKNAFKKLNLNKEGGLLPRYQSLGQVGPTSKKKKTLILAENDPEHWRNDSSSNPFMVEAGNIKNYVNKYFPGEEVEIIPTYKNNFKEALKHSDDNTRLVTLAHAGQNLFGLPASEYLQYVSETPYENCYAGICYGDEIVKGRYALAPVNIDVRNLNNFNVRSGQNQWLGFAPVNRGGEEGFKDSFFRRSKNPEIEKLNSEWRDLYDSFYNKAVNENDFNKKLSLLNKKLDEAYEKQIVNQEKAVDFKTYKFVPYPARVNTNNLPLINSYQNGGPIVSTEGFKQGPPPQGSYYRIPSNTLYNPTPYRIKAVANTGQVQYLNPFDNSNINFPGADYVDEYPIMADGGEAQGEEYIIKSGDTLNKIAKQYNTSVKKIAQANNIDNPNLIRVNQRLILPSQPKPKTLQYQDWNTAKQNLDRINALSDEQLLNEYYSTRPEEGYLIIDKKNARMNYYKGNKLIKSYEVGTGENPGDAQTVTKINPTTGKADWNAGNKSTGAGVYSISNIDPASKEYYGLPSFNMKNDQGIEVATSIHGTPVPRRVRFGNNSIADNRMSNGCINGRCEDLPDMYNRFDVGNKVYILPEDQGNRFQIVDGKPVLKVAPGNRSKYNQYVDKSGRTQKGQGINQSVNTLTYSPIRAVFDEKNFKNNVFTKFDFTDEDEYQNTTIPYYKALVNNKKQIMEAAQIPSDVYNDIAKMSFGIYGAESNFGDTHSAVGNFGRALAKYWDPESSSSPDVKAKATTYGADDNWNSVGYTQIRWAQLNDHEKNVLKKLGITSNKDFLNPEKAAIATTALLGVRYNEQLTDEQKKNLWKHLPNKWNKRSNYPERVKQNSRYLNFQQLMKDGGSLDRIVTCSNCGWSWKLSDGGKDPMTCHRCGGQIKMKNGGQTNNDREMLEGVSDILRRVKDQTNRKELANYMMNNFREERVSFKPKKFLEDSNVYKYGGLKKMQVGGLEYDINKWLGKPMEKARNTADKYAEAGNDQADNLRHPLAAMYTSQTIKNNTGNIPVLSNFLGFLGANALGLGHELKQPNRGIRRNSPYTIGETIREGAEDQFNNMVGALVGSLPFLSEQKKIDVLRYLSDNNLLPDGYGRNIDNMYVKKQKGK